MASPSSLIVSGTCLWTPTQVQIDKAEVTDFASFVQEKTQFNWHQDFQSLWQWSIDHMPEFWDLLWDWHGIIGDKGGRILANPNKMPGAEFFPDAQINFAENLTPSGRGELEITDINNMYLKNNELNVEILGRGFSWLDTGTFSSLHEASAFVQTAQNNQGLKIGCLEEIAWRNGWISDDELISI